jgi:hypothetical protein
MAKIKEIRCTRTRERGIWLIVKAITDQPGLGIDIDEDGALRISSLSKAVANAPPREGTVTEVRVQLMTGIHS